MWALHPYIFVFIAPKPMLTRYLKSRNMTLVRLCLTDASAETRTEQLYYLLHYISLICCDIFIRVLTLLQCIKNVDSFCVFLDFDAISSHTAKFDAVVHVEWIPSGLISATVECAKYLIAQLKGFTSKTSLLATRELSQANVVRKCQIFVLVTI